LLSVLSAAAVRGEAFSGFMGWIRRISICALCASVPALRGPAAGQLASASPGDLTGCITVPGCVGLLSVLSAAAVRGEAFSGFMEWIRRISICALCAGVPALRAPAAGRLAAAGVDRCRMLPRG
jgi:hypothetical protein